MKILRNYVKVAARNLRQEWGYSLLNIAGLAVGLTVFILVSLYVRQETSYDDFHSAAGRLYRIVADLKIGEREIHAPLTPGPLASTLASDFPEVAAAVRLHRTERTVRRGEDIFREEGFLYADPGIFDLFDFPARHGDLTGALAQPFQVVLSDRAASRYFGSENPVGRQLEVGGESYTVTAVAATRDVRTHVDFDFLASLESLQPGPWIDTWLANNFYTYLELAPEASPTRVTEGLARLIERRIAPPFAHSMGTSFDRFLESGGRFRYELQAVPDIHLHSNLEFELGRNGSIRLVRVLFLLAIFVLLIACINYTNLASARSGRRSLEVGLRKTLGALPGQLRFQFLVEALLTSLVALVLAWVCAGLLLERFNALVGAGFSLSDLLSPRLLVTLTVVWLSAGLAAGVYPALVLAAFPPISMVRRLGSRGRGARWFRNALVVFQFTIGVVLIIGSLVIQKQIGFLLDKDPGFDPRDLVVVEGVSELGEEWGAFKEELLRLPGVEEVSAASALPGGGSPREVYLGRAGETEQDPETSWLIDADADYFRTLGIELRSGEVFTPQDGRAVAVISPLAAERVGFEQPLGRRVSVSARPQEMTVIGTIGNLHVESLRRPLKPVVVRPLAGGPGVLAVRLQGERGPALQAVEETWRRFAPQAPYRYTLVESRMADLYRNERRVLAMTRILAVLAFFTASLGIVGLAAYAGQRRTKEIGVRKVFGATTESIVLLLVKDFLKLVAVAVVLAVPLAAWAAEIWLRDFAYRIDLPFSAFALAAGLAVLVALFAVGYQALRAARIRPALSLRSE